MVPHRGAQDWQAGVWTTARDAREEVGREGLSGWKVHCAFLAVQGEAQGGCFGFKDRQQVVENSPGPGQVTVIKEPDGPHLRYRA